MRTLLASLAVIAALLTGCSSSKNLTETSARNLIREYARDQNQCMKMSPTAVLPLMKRTLTDYTAASATGKGQDAILKRLLDRGFAVQHSETVTYPRISGYFAGADINGSEKYNLTMNPNSNIITGTMTETSRWGEVSLHNVVGASVEPNGRVTWIVDCCGFYTQNWQYREDGAVAYLEGLGGSFLGHQAGYRLTGTAGQRVEVKWYEYAFTPKFQKLVVGDGQQAYVPIASPEIGEVSGLRLVTETEATAAFAWHAPLNDAGKAFLGDDAKPAGKAGATFAKKPDGTWFVNQVVF